jgi:hypothetical protein
MGYTNVREHSEGKKAWIAAGLPVEGRADGPVNEVDRMIQFEDQCSLRHSARPALHEGEDRDARRDLRVDSGSGSGTRAELRGCLWTGDSSRRLAKGALTRRWIRGRY